MVKCLATPSVVWTPMLRPPPPLPPPQGSPSTRLWPVRSRQQVTRALWTQRGQRGQRASPTPLSPSWSPCPSWLLVRRQDTHIKLLAEQLFCLLSWGLWDEPDELHEFLAKTVLSADVWGRCLSLCLFNVMFVSLMWCLSFLCDVCFLGVMFVTLMWCLSLCLFDVCLFDVMKDPWKTNPWTPEGGKHFNMWHRELLGWTTAGCSFFSSLGLPGLVA